MNLLPPGAVRERLKRCVVHKRVTKDWFLEWYWGAYENEIRAALGMLYGSTGEALEELYGEGRRRKAEAGRGGVGGGGGGAGVAPSWSKPIVRVPGAVKSDDLVHRVPIVRHTARA
mmetsp:Transcript_36274/g.114481  ORF Transcript_36274/g.114481 Transcript_36274/m.114481 type:complete len:116 (-) Transcript_36274:112-459(-)